jgi:RNA polymerase sigma-70 factor, ECF subfamily
VTAFDVPFSPDMGAPPPITEDDVRRLVAAGDTNGAATLALRLYGPEILGFMVTVLRSSDVGADVFAEVAYHLWKDLGGFRWECSLRTWAYAIAHHRISAYQRSGRRAGATVPLSDPSVAALADQVRTTTAVYLKTETKVAVERLRASLTAEEQTILILRVDRRLAWRDVARIMDVGEPALRKRFERVKERLRDLAVEHGLR